MSEGVFRRAALLSAASALAMGVSFGASAQNPIKVTIAQPVDSPGYSVNYIAVDEGFYAKEGLDPQVETMGGGEPQAIAALHSGSAEFSAQTVVTTMQAVTRGEPLRMVAPFVREWVDQWVINPDSAKKAGITPNMPFEEKFKRLKGDTIGVFDVGGGFQLKVDAFAKEYGMDAEKDFHLTAIKSFAGLIAATKRRQVDMSTLTIPFGPMAVHQEGLAMFADFWGGDVKETEETPVNGIITEADFAAKNPDLVARMNRVMDDTLQFMQEHPDKVVADMRKHYPAIPLDAMNSVYIDDKKGFAPRAIVTRKGFTVARDFVANNIQPKAASITYENFVLPVAQEK